jgi:hypothetical protein
MKFHLKQLHLEIVVRCKARPPALYQLAYEFEGGMYFY